MLLIGAPLEKKRAPENVVDGQFSGPFVIACALARGAMGWDSYRDLHDPEIRALMARVTPVEDPEIEAEFPRFMAGKVTVVVGGTEYAETIVIASGEPENFPSEADLRAKFAGLAEAVLGAERAARLADAVLAIDQAGEVASLMRLASPLMSARLAGE
jgi:2-methylcitrate dehydratase PrpD